MDFGTPFSRYDCHDPLVTEPIGDIPDIAINNSIYVSASQAVSFKLKMAFAIFVYNASNGKESNNYSNLQ